MKRQKYPKLPLKLPRLSPAGGAPAGRRALPCSPPRPALPRADHHGPLPLPSGGAPAGRTRRAAASPQRPTAARSFLSPTFAPPSPRRPPVCITASPPRRPCARPCPREPEPAAGCARPAAGASATAHATLPSLLPFPDSNLTSNSDLSSGHRLFPCFLPHKDPFSDQEAKKPCCHGRAG